MNAPVAKPSPVHLDEFDKLEWRDICRHVWHRLGPDRSDEQFVEWFEEVWPGFVDLKRRKSLQ